MTSSKWNDHEVVLTRTYDGQVGWPLCKEVGPDEQLVPKFSWDDWTWTAHLRCEGHHPYVPDAYSEVEAHKRIKALNHAWPFHLGVRSELQPKERRVKLNEQLAEARSSAQRFPPLRTEFEAVAKELEETLRAHDRANNWDYGKALRKAALWVATAHTQAKHPTLAEEIEYWHERGSRGSALGTIGVAEAEQPVRDEWIRSYRTQLLSPGRLAAVARRGLRRDDYPPVLAWHRHLALMWAPAALVQAYRRDGFVFHEAASTPSLREMLPALWAPDSDGPLAEFDAAVKAVELLS